MTHALITCKSSHLACSPCRDGDVRFLRFPRAMPAGVFTPGRFQPRWIGQGVRDLTKNGPWSSRLMVWRGVNHHTLYRKAENDSPVVINKIQFSNNFIYGSRLQNSQPSRGGDSLFSSSTARVCSPRDLVPRTPFSYQGMVTRLHLCFFSTSSP